MDKPLAPLATLALAVLACGSLAACSAIRPTLPTTGADRTAARDLLAASVEAHGGNVYAALDDVAVSYEGEWGWWVRRLQPVLTDSGHRKSSEERLLVGDGLVFQRHAGPAGVKTVLRDAESVDVQFTAGDGGSRTANEEERAAAALVADVYEMFLFGPSFFLRHGEEPSLLAPVTEKGRAFQRLAVRLEPGFGFAESDLAELWIDRETKRLYRVLFTIDGLASTRGAAVDTTFFDHREIGGFVWPTRFVERVRAPLRVFAHRWWMIGLDLDRGLEPGDLSAPELGSEAARPAEPLPPAS